MFEVKITCKFQTKTAEQAEYIAQFFRDAESLMTCETSWSERSEVRDLDADI